DGRSFGRPITVPGSVGHGYHRSGIGFGLPKYGWDPSVAVAPDHTIYVAYMLYRHSHVHPVVAISYDHGATFARLSRPASPVKNNWGDRDFITVGPTGTVYLTWDFGRSLSVKSRHGNIVIQKSRDGGKTWSPITVVSPGFPDHGGGVAAPLLAEPGGRPDVAFWVGSRRAPAPYALPPNHLQFPSSVDGCLTWSKPVAIRPGAGRIGYFVTWIDVALGTDAAGNLYATWDTQSPGGDIGWLSYSTDLGRMWTPARRVTPDHDKAEHVMAVTAGAPAGSPFRGGCPHPPPRAPPHPRPRSRHAPPPPAMPGAADPAPPPVRQPQHLARRPHRHLHAASPRTQPPEDPAQLGQRSQQPDIADLHRHRKAVARPATPADGNRFRP